MARCWLRSERLLMDSEQVIAAVKNDGLKIVEDNPHYKIFDCVVKQYPPWRVFVRTSGKPIMLGKPMFELMDSSKLRQFADERGIQRRAKARNTSRLERIPGVGPKKRRELLRQFGGLQGVMGAGVDDLAKVRGISRTLAQTIYNDLHIDGQH